MKKLPVIKKSNWGGSRTGAGRKPKTEYESREIFKTAFDKVIEPNKWEEIIQNAWESKNWNMIKFLIEQRIGKAIDIKEAPKNRQVRIILGDSTELPDPE